MNTKSSQIMPNSILNDNQEQFFADNGYVGPFSLSDNSSAIELKQSIGDSSENARLECMSGRDSHIIFKPVFKLATESSILDSVSSILGSDLLLWIGQVIYKNPGDGLTCWHIDEINYAVGGVHVSVAITDMNINNGCLQVIPGTHKYQDDLKEYANKGECDLDSSESMVQLANRLHPENAPHQIVPVEMKAGEYFLDMAGLWHAALANQTDKIRLGLVARYMRPDVSSKKACNLDCSLPCILVRGEDNKKLNTLYKPPLNKLQIMHNKIYRKYLYNQYKNT
jgi:non-heme Fe2+,alpha-ketoglutarate-dependent halogenase